MKLSSILESYGIVHQFSCPYSHPQMGSVERRHRHLVDTGVTLLQHASLPHKLWDYAIM